MAFDKDLRNLIKTVKKVSRKPFADIPVPATNNAAYDAHPTDETPPSAGRQPSIAKDGDTAE
jgi:hypothetical protein